MVKGRHSEKLKWRQGSIKAEAAVGKRNAPSITRSTGSTRQGHTPVSQETRASSHVNDNETQDL